MPSFKAQVKYLEIVVGETKNSHKEFLKKLCKNIPHMKKVSSAEECTVVLVFCPVVSRCGTDLQVALNELKNKSDPKPAVIIVLHHTYDPEKCVPDNSRNVYRENTLIVDCLFHEDKGFLDCIKNQAAINRTVLYIEGQKRASAAASTEDSEKVPLLRQNTEDNDIEQDPSACCCSCRCC